MTAVQFALPAGTEAGEQPERRGLARDAVRLLVARPDRVEHHRFRDLPDLLAPGDLVVVNTSATVAAALDVRRAGGRSVVHVGGTLDDGDWVIELRLPDGPDLTAYMGKELTLPGHLRLRLRSPYPHPDVLRSRLWRATPSRPVDAVAHLTAFGRPIGYRYLVGRYPLQDCADRVRARAGQRRDAQRGPALHGRHRARSGHARDRHRAAGAALRAVQPGAARAAGARAVHRSRTRRHAPSPPRGRQAVASSPSARPSCARLRRSPHPTGPPAAAAGGRISCWSPTAHAVSGLVTGLHAPEASHLLLLEATVGERMLRDAYQAAVAECYLWHEFGDSSLFLP